MGVGEEGEGPDSMEGEGSVDRRRRVFVLREKQKVSRSVSPDEDLEKVKTNERKNEETHSRTEHVLQPFDPFDFDISIQQL